LLALYALVRHEAAILLKSIVSIIICVI
jgi:hypothetical protein